MNKKQIENEKLRLMVFESAMELGEKLDEHLHWLREISLYNTGVEACTSDKVLILQTCSIKYDGNFLIIGGRKVI